jgi:hypothetical protein
MTADSRKQKVLPVMTTQSETCACWSHSPISCSASSPGCGGSACDRRVSLMMNFGIIEVPDPGRAGHNRGHGVFALAAG